MLLTVLLTLAAALTAAAATKAAPRSALDAYLVKNPGTFGALVSKLRPRVRTQQDAEDLAGHAIAVAIRRERTGKGRRFVEGGPYPPFVHLMLIAKMLLRMSWQKGKSIQSLPLDEPDILESDDRNVEEMAIELDDQDERAEFVRKLREYCKRLTKGQITLGILDNASIRDHGELARIMGCEPNEVKLGYDRLMRRAAALREELGAPS